MVQFVKLVQLESVRKITSNELSEMEVPVRHEIFTRLFFLKL